MGAAAIFRRKLRSHRDQVAYDERCRAAGEARRAERQKNFVADMAAAAAAGQSLMLYHATIAEPRAIDMAAYYRRDADFEKRRGIFYSYCAMIFGSQGWAFSSPEVAMATTVGFGGKGQKIAPLDQSTAASINTTSAPLEFMIARGYLDTPDDSAGAGLMRYAVALRVRSTITGAQVSPLKAQSYQGGGGGGGSGRPVSDFVLDSIKAVNHLRARLTPGDFRLLEQVLYRDEWLWERHRSRRKQQLLTLAIHRAIDRAGVVFGMITEEEVRRRWARRPRSAASSSAR